MQLTKRNPKKTAETVPEIGKLSLLILMEGYLGLAD